MTKLENRNKGFQDKEDKSIGVRTEGEIKGGDTEKTGNENTGFFNAILDSRKETVPCTFREKKVILEFVCR